jgi:dephospho-CoA kinase
MVVIGLTGGLGTGKTTVARMFERLGAVVLDADRLAHRAMEPKRLAWRQIVKTFGPDVLNEDETINRRWLADRVFQDEEARRQLEAIVHPRVLRYLADQIKRLAHGHDPSGPLARERTSRKRKSRPVKVVVLDVPLLLEANAQRLADVVVVVTAPPEVQRQRLLARGMSETEIERRIAAQWDVSAKVALADCVVDNSDGLEQTRRQVTQAWNRLQKARRRNSRHA